MAAIVTTTQDTGLPDLIEDGGEVRVLDTILAERLGYDRPRDIRKLVKRHREALGGMGSLLHRGANPGPKGGRRATAFYLTEVQTLFILAKSETARANVELAYVTQVFTEFRRGNLVARDADTQARLDAYQADRQARLARHLEEKEAREDALRFLNRGCRR
ncbi:hypothetical protein [Paramagnetospirillum magneticum]|uniref:Uncharacterized protein n=1 Tax=Paramagnetospirillum magneticum (strain ATCC 700264 / AMB-1) TaxID=342108 RepID=Q2VZX0_PARM1|nr:hypothetical protein [Paramagnetospirillum magneticum]BAE52855.1 hypothetical protein amb4051 [Paramagnetospirillum magneticum AMB-1]